MVSFCSPFLQAHSITHAHACACTYVHVHVCSILYTHTKTIVVGKKRKHAHTHTHTHTHRSIALSACIYCMYRCSIHMQQKEFSVHFLHMLGNSCTCLETVARAWKLLHVLGNSCTCLETLAHAWKLLHMTCTCLETLAHAWKTSLLAHAVNFLLSAVSTTCFPKLVMKSHHGGEPKCMLARGTLHKQQRDA